MFFAINKVKGKKLTWNNWHADHIKPWSLGHLTVLSNAQLLCRSCNNEKGNKF